MTELAEIWSKAKKQLSDEISAVSYDTWIKPISVLSADDKKITMEVPSPTVKSMLLTRYNSIITDCIESVTSRKYALEVLVANKNRRDYKAVSAANTLPENLLNPRYTFETFVVGKNNELAQSAALAAAEQANVYNPLYIYGGSGLGKTHLLQAVGNYYIENYPEKKIIYTTTEKFTYDFVSAIQHKKTFEFKQKYRTADLLLIDDIQFLSDKTQTYEEFFHTFNALYEAGKQMVITSDRLPSDIPHIPERLRTRFQMGLLVDVQPPEFETRMAILKDKIAAENISVDDEVLEYVAHGIRSNVRDLEGAVKRMMAYGAISRTNKISMELAEKALKDIFSSMPQKKLTISSVIDETERYFNLPSGTLRSKQRTARVTLPRHIAMYISQSMLGASQAKIGREFGGRDHSTVISATKKIELLLSEENPEVKRAITDISENLSRD